METNIKSSFQCRFADCDDSLTIWWANIFSIDALWLLGEDAAAESLCEWIENVPKEITECKDPIARAAIAAFSAKRLLM